MLYRDRIHSHHNGPQVLHNFSEVVHGVCRNAAIHFPRFWGVWGADKSQLSSFSVFMDGLQLSYYESILAHNSPEILLNHDQLSHLQIQVVRSILRLY